MEKANGAYNYDRYDNNWLKSLCTMSNVEALAKQGDWPAGHNSLHRSQYDTHDKKRSDQCIHPDLTIIFK